ncbi:MAG: NAD-dependent epimerase/dehydratase family protein, partial [Alphaproteobacteria bacterium]
SELVRVGDLTAVTDWTHAVCGVNVVVHTAARVHVMHEQSGNVINIYRRTNVDGTLNLARQAADAGVKRFIFLSSIKVNGEFTCPDRFFTAEDVPNPLDAYSVSKLEAEQGLYEIGAQRGMEIVCIRPPLVYGPRVKGNFLSMMRWLDRGVPLPLRAVHNRRSLIALDNLVDLIVTCLDHPAAANQTFPLSDDEDLSTSDLLRRMCVALDRPVRLLPIPPSVIRLAMKLVGKEEMALRLLGDLQVDFSKTKRLLGWRPSVSVDQGLKKTAEWYLQLR